LDKNLHHQPEPSTQLHEEITTITIGQISICCNKGIQMIEILVKIH